MKQILFRSFIISGIALLIVSGIVYAYSGNANIVVEGDYITGEPFIGSGGVLVDSPPAKINSDLLPTTDNAFDIGTAAYSWKNGVFDGTFTANGAATFTGTTSTFSYGATFATTGGNVGIGTVSASSKLTLYKTGTNPSLFDYSNGLATSTYQAGANGFATSTISEDFVVNNLYTGMLQLPDDSNSDIINVPVSSAMATGTIAGYGFTIDSLGFASVNARSDALGSVWDKRFEISNGAGTATTSIMQSRNAATSTPLADYKESTGTKGSGSCLVLTDAVTGAKVYASIESAVWVLSTASCLATDNTLTR